MNVCILTGAGFVKPLGLPTSTEFEVPKTGLTDLIKGFLKENNHNYEDIERILMTAEEFTKEDFTLFVAERSIPRGQELTGKIHSLKTSGRRFVIELKKSIYRQLVKFPEEEAFRLYLGFLKVLEPQNNKISFITTNYDRTFERTFSKHKEEFSSIGIKKVIYHFSEDSGDLVFNPKPKYRGFEYVKLHGSLDWYEEDGRTVKTSATVLPDDPEKPPILYPGYKSMPDKEPFISLHRIFLSRLFWSDLVLIVGFALRDAVINFLLDTAMQRKKSLKVLFINPGHEYPPESWYLYFASSYGGRFLHIPKGIEVSDSPLGVSSLRELLQLGEE